MKIKTAKGYVSFAEILENVYKPNGFTVEHFDNVIPKLRLHEQQSCIQIYSNWLNASKTTIKPLDNVQVLLHNNYTLNGYISLSQCYFYNESYNNEKPNVDKIEAINKWSQENIDGWVKEIKDGKYTERSDKQYIDSASVFYATKHYNIAGKKGAVIGSISPWVESMCLANGASQIVTIDYQHIKIGHDSIMFLDAFDLVKAREIFDFIVSYSSIEYSGLGRYGDPTNPMGDIMEMQKLRCILKPRGIFFLGVPVGQDDVGYNCHRTYGRIRLPLMFAVDV
uniref:DUF268 domain-containing protein n=1 Tax=Meloidogyne javanica TaxID=6303 RepID=A0A915LYW3_MELJA